MLRILVSFVLGILLGIGGLMAYNYDHAKGECEKRFHLFGKWRREGNFGQFPGQVRSCRYCGFSEIRPILPP